MTPAPTPGNASAGNAYQALFDAAYYASKAPAFQPLYNGRIGAQTVALKPLTQAQVIALTAQLLAQGYTIDEEIDFLGMDPYTIMYCRQQYGIPWVYPGLGNVLLPPANELGAPVGPAPAGVIKTSTLIADYPAYPVPADNAPVTPPLPPVANPVGIRIIAQVPAQPNFVGDVFRCAFPNDGFAFGATWTGTSGAFTGTWTKQGLEAGMMTVWVKTA